MGLAGGNLRTGTTYDDSWPYPATTTVSYVRDIALTPLEKYTLYTHGGIISINMHAVSILPKVYAYLLIG